ncbi:hypothetical protein O181_091337 [Austropuccinia psidii MF-1]|uniref:Uncharacterized protein n=1 Tax=Austropuccinia psidii MF-1 TaxID=1389203 RepID=A0A9Q3IX38_9BASI|nr:hypothetical protein [Austropuccinia psidii MF-1]
MVHHPENDESANENQIKTRIIQLDRSNWVQWSCQLKNYLKGCGYQELLHPPSDTAKITSKQGTYWTDSKPFDIITVTKQVSLEHKRNQNHSEEVLFNKPSTSKEDDKKGPKAHDNQSRGKRRNKKKKEDSKPASNDKNPSLSQRMEQLKKLILSNPSTRPKRDQPEHIVSSPQETNDPQQKSESDTYYLPIKGFITDHQDRSQKIYLDSGCG